MPFSVRETPIVELLKKGKDLTKAHWDEIVTRKELMELSPDYDMYEAIEDMGGLLSLGLYQDDELIGYSVTLIQNHLHYSNLRCGFNDLLFVSQAKRRTGAGLLLIEETEKRAKECGVRFYTWHAKPGTTLGLLLEKRGAKVHDIIYGVEL